MSKSNSKPSVSLVTISQLKRFSCLQILEDLIKEQTYDNIIEWVIMEGSKTAEDAKINAENIKSLIEKSTLKCKIIYCEYVSGIKLGELRNIANNKCSGEITVCMDDDDYYPPSRVSHAVEKLSSSKAKIAGCSAVLIYDYFLEKLYKFKQFGPNHSTNNCMAWKKSYLTTNKHDGDKEMAEEASFTKTFSEPIVQLEAEKTIVVSSHTSNTFNKRELLVKGTNGLNPTLNEVNCNINDYIKEPYYSKYKGLFVKEKDSIYDIVYLAGCFSIKWDPSDMSLGGSEQAIVNLVTNWAKKGKKVAVYGEVPNKNYLGVDYFDWKKFPFEEKHKLVILWRNYGIYCGLPFPLKANKIWLDCHDNFQSAFNDLWKKYGNKIHKVFFKSIYHKSEFQKVTKEILSDDRYYIIPNGVRVENFIVNKDNVPKNPYRFCYCSCYTRGLVEIIRYIWPIIYGNEPRAELHVYYGMDGIRDENHRNILKEVLSMPGVMDHGRQPMEIIAREKHMSSYQLYVTNTTAEIDCISIRESLATGCIPLISNFGVFSEREGIKFELNEKDPKSFQMVGIRILHILRSPEKIMDYRQQIKKSQLLVTWREIGEMWMDEMSP